MPEVDSKLNNDLHQKQRWMRIVNRERALSDVVQQTVIKAVLAHTQFLHHLVCRHHLSTNQLLLTNKSTTVILQNNNNL